VRTLPLPPFTPTHRLALFAGLIVLALLLAFGLLFGG